MSLDAVGAALRAVTSTPVSTDPVDQIKATAQVRVLTKVLQARSEMEKTLLATIGDVGRHLDVRA